MRTMYNSKHKSCHFMYCIRVSVKIRAAAMTFFKLSINLLIIFSFNPSNSYSHSSVEPLDCLHY